MDDPGMENIMIECVTTNVTSESEIGNHGDCQVDSDGEAQNSVKDIDHDEQKDDIYEHPLFDLMCQLFEKCEHATLTADCPSPESFDSDINKFIQTNEEFLSNNYDLDVLVIKAIQVLRIHLLELDKVSELCKDFCSRYISCLKAKLHSDNLLRVEGCDFEFDPEMTSPVSSPPLPPEQPQGNVLLHSPPLAVQGQIISGSTMYQMVQTPQGIVAQPLQIQASSVSATTPSLVNTSVGMINSKPVSLLTSHTEDSHRNGKRGILPKSATQIMKSWLFQNIVHPYPTEDQKRQLAVQTNLTLLQVNNWFINARRRILQPMLDSNPAVEKLKKPRPSSKQNNRHWPKGVAPTDITRYEFVENEGVVEMTLGGCVEVVDNTELLEEEVHTDDVLATTINSTVPTLIVPTPPRTFTISTHKDNT